VCKRLIGTMTLTPVSGVAAQDYNVSIGIAVVTADAVAAGVVPDPVGDAQQDWYYWTAWEGELNSAGQSNWTKEFDIRTSRRLREGYRLMFQSENSVQELGATLFVRLRTLWSLP